MKNKGLMISNQRLLESWSRYKEHSSEENATAFFEELKTAYFFVPIDRTSKEEKMSLKVTRFLILVSQKHNNFLPAFTDLHEWEKWPFQTKETAVIGYEDLRQILADHSKRLVGICINPFGQNLILGQNELAAIDRMTEDSTYPKKNSSVQIIVTGEDEKPITIQTKGDCLKEH